MLQPALRHTEPVATDRPDHVFGTRGMGRGTSLRQSDRRSWRCTNEPGKRVDLSAGWSHATSPVWSLMLQANYSQRARDSGEEAEPELSGSRTLNLSPGVSVAAGHDDLVYAVVQAPVYQQVNGIQLVPRYSLAFGWTHSF